jgi:TolB-like protein/Flp pilus assembly protein TadD
VFLEKDPKWRFQNPTELVDALPKVNDAIKARRAITDQDLRTSTDKQLSTRSKATSALSRSISVIGSRRPHLIVWVALALLAAGGLIAIVSNFFGASHRIPDASIPALSETKIPEKSIAVLPFDSLSENKSDTYFADGVQDEILSNLAKVSQLKVISRTSVMSYRAIANRNLRSIASALGVANVVEGTVRRDGNRVRVTTELVDARTDQTLWSDSYDRDLTDIFAIQSDIAQTVASKLSAQLSPKERKDIEEKPTNNLEAYDLYLQAKQLISRESSILVLPTAEQATFSKGIKLLEEAVKKDPDFALGYCLIAKAHDFLYFDQLDGTPERRTLGDAAVNEALRLRPDLAEVHLAQAFHLYTCYRDSKRVRVQIDIAARDLKNDPDLLELTAMIDRRQGRWEESTGGLEKAVALDPRSPELLESLADNYTCLRRYRDAERMHDRLIVLKPDDPLFRILKVTNDFREKGELKSARAAYEALPSSVKDDSWIILKRVYYAMCDRDWAAALELVNKGLKDQIYFAGEIVPRRVANIWTELLKGENPTIEEFGSTREQLRRKVEADPANPTLLGVLAYVDVALGQKEEAIREARRAVEMRPISEDADEGPYILWNLITIYAWADKTDLAFEQMSILMKAPNSRISYGGLKFDPGWDPMRKDPRFDKLLAELAPHN